MTDRPLNPKARARVMALLRGERGRCTMQELRAVVNETLSACYQLGEDAQIDSVGSRRFEVIEGWVKEVR